jgi:hypothetical protein
LPRYRRLCRHCQAATAAAAAKLPPHCRGRRRQAAVATAKLSPPPPLHCCRAAMSAATLPLLPLPCCHHRCCRTAPKLLPLAPLPLFSFVVVAVIVAVSIAVAATNFCWFLVIAYTRHYCHRWSLCCHHAAAALIKMKALLGFWLVGVLWATPPLPPTEIKSWINYVFVIHKHKISFGTGNLCVTNTYHLYVFVICKHKKSFGYAPVT